MATTSTASRCAHGSSSACASTASSPRWMRCANASGQIVCNVSTTAGGAAAFPGCQPINLFGRGGGGQPTPAGYDYVVGFEPGQSINDHAVLSFDRPRHRALQLHHVGGEGEPDHVLAAFRRTVVLGRHRRPVGAGAIAGAFGGSYRQDEIFQRVQDVTNPTSNHVSGRPVMCNDPTINLRGVNRATVRQHRGQPVLQGLQHPRHRRGVGGLRRIAGAALRFEDFTAVANGAVRWADYSGSGTIWAYKGGLELGFIDRSGPPARHLFARRARRQPVRTVRPDRRLRQRHRSAQPARQRSRPTTPSPMASPRLRAAIPMCNPEEADTWTAGVVLQPDFLARLLGQRRLLRHRDRRCDQHGGHAVGGQPLLPGPGAGILRPDRAGRRHARPPRRARIR